MQCEWEETQKKVTGAYTATICSENVASCSLLPTTKQFILTPCPYDPIIMQFVTNDQAVSEKRGYLASLPFCHALLTVSPRHGHTVHWFATGTTSYLLLLQRIPHKVTAWLVRFVCSKGRGVWLWWVRFVCSKGRGVWLW